MRPSFVAFVAFFSLAVIATAGSLTPSAAPGSTMHSVGNIYDVLASAGYDSTLVGANQNGSLLGMLKYVNNNMLTSNLSADVSIASHGYNWDFANTDVLVGGFTLHSGQTSGTSLAWTERQPSGGPPGDAPWQTVASDATGQHLIAGGLNGRLYTSDDSGITWHERQPLGFSSIRQWNAVSSDADGSFLIAGTYADQHLYVSSHSGDSWAERFPGGTADHYWNSVAADATGQHLIAADDNGNNGSLYISDDFGVSWTEQFPDGATDCHTAFSCPEWLAVATSTDGSHLIAAAYGGDIYTYASGVWTDSTPAGQSGDNWQSVSSDATGSHLIAAVNGGRVYISSDYGVHWAETMPTGVAENKPWLAVATDADGSHFIAGVSNGRLYTGDMPAIGLFEIQHGATTALSISSDGHVGIGTTNPETALEIVGTASASQFFGAGLEIVGTASASQFFGAGLVTCGGVRFLQWSGGIFDCASLSGPLSLGSLVFASSFESILTPQVGLQGYTNFSGGIGTGGVDSLTPAPRFTSSGNLENIGSIHAGETLLTRGGTFAPAVFYDNGTGTGSSYLTLADLNGDGFMDIAAVNPNNDTVSVFLNHGDGTFAAAVLYPVGHTPFDVAAADLNGDGETDLAVTSSGASVVSVLLNHGDGTFAAGVDYPAGTGIEDAGGVHLGDVNGDGVPDIVVANEGSSAVSVLVNHGDGTFATAVAYSLGSVENNRDLVLADFNGDGRADIATGSAITANIFVFLNNGDGTFAAPISYAGYSPNSIAAADVNGDGAVDIVAAHPTGVADGVVSILLNHGDGTFAIPADYTVPGAKNYVYDLALADLNGDGMPDVVVANGDTDTATILMNNGDGTFGAATAEPTGDFPVSVALADLNGDGKSDIVTGDTDGTDVAVLLNQSSPLFFAQASTGNVGIGTLTPMAKLEVAGPGATAEVRINANTMDDNKPRLTFYSSFDDPAERNWGIATSLNQMGDFSIQQSTNQGGNPIDSGISRLSIDPNGFVGISSASPEEMLSVTGNGIFSSNNSVAPVSIILSTMWSSEVGNIPERFTLTNFPVDDVGTSRLGIIGAGGEIMSLRDSGNVGIGTTNPETTLEVVGTASVSALYVGGVAVTGGSVAPNSLDFSDFMASMSLDTNTSIASHGFTLNLNDTKLTAGIILPEMTGAVGTMSMQTIGDPSHWYKDIYTESMHLGPSSLYMNGQLVLSETGSNMNFTTSTDQNLVLQTSGDGNASLKSGTTGNVNVQTGGNGNINITATTGAIWLTSPNIHLNGVVSGNLIPSLLQVVGAATASYSRFGTDTTSHGLGAASDLLISGKLETNGSAWFDGTASISGNLDVSGTASVSSLYVGGLAVTGGPSSQWTTTGSDIYYNLGKVEVGTTNQFTVDTLGNLVANAATIGTAGVAPVIVNCPGCTPNVAGTYSYATQFGGKNEYYSSSTGYYVWYRAGGINQWIVGLSPGVVASDPLWYNPSTSNLPPGSGWSVYGGALGVLTTSAGTLNQLTIDAGGGITTTAAGRFGLASISGSFEVTGYASVSKLFVGLTGTQTTFAVCHPNDGQTTGQQLVDCNPTAGDYMEMYPMDPTVEEGDIVAPSSQSFTIDIRGNRVPILVRATTSYQDSLLGVVSIASQSNDFNTVGRNLKPEDNPKPLALAGRVLLKVSTQNGPIIVGDRITSSDIPGVGMKATQAGAVVGTALEPLDTLATASYQQIMVFVQPQYWAPPVPTASVFEDMFAAVIDAFKSIMGIVFKPGGVIEAQQLCLGDTCVTQSQLNELLQRGRISAPVDTPTPTPTPTDTLTPTPTPTETPPPSPSSSAEASEGQGATEGTAIPTPTATP